jgi:hypothetical protein
MYEEFEVNIRVVLVGLAVLAVAGLALYFLGGSRQASAGAMAERRAEPSAERGPAERATEAPPAAPVTGMPLGGAPAEAPAAPAAASLTPEEVPVLAMYDAIADRFGADPKNCDAMGTAFEELVDRHGPDLERWAQARSGASAEQRQADEQRLEDTAGPRMRRAQTAIRNGMMACPQHARFQSALRKLAEASQAP